MKKRIFTIFLVILLAVTNLTVCYAEGVDALTNIGLNNYKDTIGELFSSHNDGNGETKNLGDVVDNGSSGIIKVVMNILSFIPKAVVNLLLEVILFIFPCMDDIVFNDRVSLWGNFFRLTYFDEVPGGLAGGMVSFVSTVYQAFRYLALIGFVIAIACIAVKMILSSVGKQKAQYKESLKNWMIGLVLLVVGHWIMIYAIYFSEFLVEVIVNVKDNLLSGWTTALEQGGNGTFDLVSTFSSAVGASGAAAWGVTLVIIWAVMALVAIVVFVAMNLKIVKVYLERVIVVGVLIMIFPLITVFYAFEKGGVKKGNTFESWLRIFIDQVFIQPVHALTLMGVCIALNAISHQGIVAIPIVGMILVLMVLNTMFTIENVIKRVFAINGAGLGQPVNPMGAAMAGLGVSAGMLKDGLPKYRQALSTGGKGFKNRLKATGGLLKNAYTYARADKDNFAAPMLGLAGISIPREFSRKPFMTRSETARMDAVLKGAVKTGKLDTSNNLLYDAFHNKRAQMDSSAFSQILSDAGISQHRISEILSGVNVPKEPGPNASDQEKAEYKKYLDEVDRTRMVMAAMENPELNISDYKNADGTFNEKRMAGLGFTNSQERKAIKKARSGSTFAGANNADRDEFEAGFYRYAFSHKDEYEELKESLGISDEQIEDVFAGDDKPRNASEQAMYEQNKLKVQAMSEGMLDSGLDVTELTNTGRKPIRLPDGTMEMVTINPNKLESVRMDVDTRDSQSSFYATGGISGNDYSNTRVLLEGYRRTEKGYFNERAQQVGIDQQSMNAFLSGQDSAIAEDDLRALLYGLSDTSVNLNDIKTNNSWDFSKMGNTSTPNTLDYQMSVLTNAMNTGSFDSTSISAFNDYIQAMPSHYQDALQEVNSYNYLSNNEINEQFMQDVINGVNRNPDDIAAAQLVIQKLLNKI